mmetsp:Transcript_1175/g.2627  ORF Transcript_1175/g.2627 Transcript_1175/m.2627 type:complete len:235 (+) Transcript_1175:890-1594(+)
MQFLQDVQVERREGVMPSRAFGVAIAPSFWRHIFEGAIRLLVPHQAGIRVVRLAQPLHRSGVKFLRFLRLTKDLSRYRDGSISKGKIQGSGTGLPDLDVHRNVALILVVLKSKFSPRSILRRRVDPVGVLLQGLPGDLVVKTRDVLDDCIRDDDVSERAYHAISVARTRPLRQPTSSQVGVQPSLNDLPELPGVGQGEQRIDSSEGVPEAVVCDPNSVHHFATIGTPMLDPFRG